MRRLDRGRCVRLHVSVQPLGQREQLNRIDFAARRQHQPRGNELLLQPIATILPGGGAHRLLVAEHRAANRLPAERGFEQMVVDQIVGRVRRFAKLRKDDLLLSLQMLHVEVRRTREVGDQLREQRQVSRQCPAGEYGLIAAGPGIERPADVLDYLGQRPSVAAAGTFEHHMLDEMSKAAEPPRLGARADAGIKADRHGFGARHRVGRDGQSIGQHMLLGLHRVSPSRLRTANP